MSQKTETSCISDLMSSDIRYTVLNRAINDGARMILDKNDIKIIGDDIEGYLYIVADNLDTVKKSNAEVIFDDYYSVICYEEDIAEYIKSKNIGFNEILKFKVFKYNSKEKFDGLEGDFRQLDLKYVDTVDREYPYLDTVEITERIKTGNIFGLFVENNLAGFIGIHREGTLGMLRIFDEYRNRGYAYQLEGLMINHMLDNAMEIVCDVMVDNESSMALQRKLGLEESEKCENTPVKLLCIDPAYPMSYTAYWNCVIFLPKNYDDDTYFVYLTDIGKENVLIDDAIIFI